MDEGNNYLVIGLGNPGTAYASTRHNVGYRIVQALADKYGAPFKHASHLIGDLAQTTQSGKKLLMLLPTTFMNSSGDAVKRCMAYYRVPADRIMVVSDEVALPIGTMRMRTKGSSGGHNGLKSIEEHLRTEHYARLRIGVSAPGQEGLSDYVLGKFTQEENRTVEGITLSAIGVLDLWITAGIAAAMQAANTKTPPKDEQGQ